MKFNYREELLNNLTPNYKKIEIIFELMNIGDEQSLDILFEVIKKDFCELVRHEAIFALGEMGPSKKSLNFLKQTLEIDDSLVVKHECLMSIGTIGSKEDIFFLEQFIQDSKFEISCSAKIAIDRINQIEDFESDVKNNLEYYITKLFDYKNSNQNDRVQILFQLMRIGDEICLNAILKCLKEDPCRIVRHEAGFVLGEVGTQKAVEYMIKGLENETTPIVIHETLFALGTSGNKNSIKFISNFLINDNYVISESAKIALDRINYLENPYSGAKHFLS